MELVFDQYLTEFLAVLAITVLTIIIPGPDFIVVARNSLSYSRRAGMLTGMGVATAVWIHVGYTLAGIGLILSKSILLFAIVKYLGAAYLIYLGWSCIRSSDDSKKEEVRSTKPLTDFQAFRMGFINNALNPKATLFFLSLFTQVVSPTTPMVIQLSYGLIASVSCMAWFTLVAMFLNNARLRALFKRSQYYFEKVMGVVLVSFGVKVALSAR